MRLRTRHPRAVVFAPPLIGGNLSQQVRFFRNITAHGYDLVSFTYSGHGKSDGHFSLDSALNDTVCVLDYLLERCQKESLPVLGIGSCSSAIPLLYGAFVRPGGISGIVLINAITGIRAASVLSSLMDYYRLITRRDYKKHNISDVVGSYLEYMLPGVLGKKWAFGDLEFKRAKPMRILLEALAWNPLKHISFDKLPVLCLYGREDRVLRLYEAGCENIYRTRIKSLCPGVRFVPLEEEDHFLSGSGMRFRILAEMLGFFRQNTGFQLAE